MCSSKNKNNSKVDPFVIFGKQNSDVVSNYNAGYWNSDESCVTQLKEIVISQIIHFH